VTKKAHDKDSATAKFSPHLRSNGYELELLKWGKLDGNYEKRALRADAGVDGHGYEFFC
jgi:hypothetical protein